MPRPHTILCLALAPLAIAVSKGAVAHDHAMSMDMTMRHAAADPSGEPGKAAEVTRTISIVMGDLSFTPAAIQVKKGEVIRFVVKNASAADHDFTLGDASTQAAHRVEMAKASDSGLEMHHHAGGNAVSVKAGDTQEVIWKFTSAATLEYDCNIPGHYEAGMKGSITVAP
jgi:uncharacterized cupredoxin-like copper-binding protein